MDALFSSPYKNPDTHPISKNAKEAITLECSFQNGFFTFSNRSFSGIIVKFSNAPAFSSSFMDASP
jgi:hypothetical protein